MFHLFTDVHTREFTGVKAKPSKLRLCNSACWEMYRVGGNNTHTHTHTAQSDQGRSRDLRDNQDATYLTHTHTKKREDHQSVSRWTALPDGSSSVPLLCTERHIHTHPLPSHTDAADAQTHTHTLSFRFK